MVHKIPITARAPQPGDHVTVRSTSGDKWRHGIVMEDGTVATGATRVPWSEFGDSEYMVYVVVHDDDQRAMVLERASYVLERDSYCPVEAGTFFADCFHNEDSVFAAWCTQSDLDTGSVPPHSPFYNAKADGILCSSFKKSV